MASSSESHGTYDLNDTPAPAKPVKAWAIYWGDAVMDVTPLESRAKEWAEIYAKENPAHEIRVVRVTITPDGE